MGGFINPKEPITFTNRQEPEMPMVTTGLPATEDLIRASKEGKNRGQDVMNRLEFRKLG
ncbi:MAG: hypothetical protein PHW85_05010 [Bacteroidales bacterium]|nr:hypothetical protein [Bacteroidales bacterium]MDD4420926.1 hypothetical protein [Bacteroidales bacterium]